MGKARTRIEQLDERELRRIFEAVVRGESRASACSLLALRHRTTVARTYNIVLEFHNRGLKELEDSMAEQIAERDEYPVSVRRVRTLFAAWKTWNYGDPLITAQNKPDERGQWLRQQHLTRLLQGIDPIRKCISNPWDSWAHANPGPPLRIGGHDWALVPKLWFSVVTPRFVDELDWGRAFPQLKKPLEESPFWGDLAELESMTLAVAKDLESAADELGRTDDDFRMSWSKLQELIVSGWVLQNSRTPRHPVPDWEKTKPPYGDGYAENVCRALAGGIMADVYDRLWALVSQLDVVRDDLEPGVVDKVIAEGTCPECPR
tara:strand:- start:1052 stop:2008 length:957 start_codon:yes stop_codon:yes gene_type:complete